MKRRQDDTDPTTTNLTEPAAIRTRWCADITWADPDTGYHYAEQHTSPTEQQLRAKIAETRMRYGHQPLFDIHATQQNIYPRTPDGKVRVDTVDLTAHDRDRQRVPAEAVARTLAQHYGTRPTA